jgi:hypothetical protein
MTTKNDSIALRLAGVDEDHVIRRLAELDDTAPLEGRVLLALIEGNAVAALSLEDGRAVADPFVPTAGVLALLRLRAAHLSARSAPDRRGRGTRRRGPRRVLRAVRPRVA